MAFRTVVIDSHAKLEYSLNYLVYRSVETVKRVLMDEIQTLVIQSTEVSLTAALLSECSKRKIKVIFCDQKRNPESELISYCGAHNSYRRIMEQLSWTNVAKGEAWAAIVKRKILGQSWMLRNRKQEERANELLAFARDVLPDDPTNREGHAAKVYFNSVFHPGFARNNDDPINAYLNYGYSILLSQFNRAVVASGYLTAVGIHHKGETNPFNFSCDLMEPFRPFVDAEATTIKEGDDFKLIMIQSLSKEVAIDGKRQSLSNAVSIYCQSVFTALNDQKITNIKFPEYE